MGTRHDNTNMGQKGKRTGQPTKGVAVPKSRWWAREEEPPKP